MKIMLYGHASLSKISIVTLPSSSSLLSGFPKNIGLGLRPSYFDLLAKLGNPHKHLPPIFHVAGTNGKGSTCAFLRAILEAAGYRVHVYTSPHLVRFHERIRVAGKLIAEDSFVEILQRCQKFSTQSDITVFEALTATALTAFAETSADFTILEVGLGGRLDATNVIEKPIASIITRLSYDHRQHLGNSLGDIAREKAGIIRGNVPCFSAPQPDAEAVNALRDAAEKIGAPLYLGGIDWTVTPHENGMRYSDAKQIYDLPLPALTGEHQLWNAGLAISALSVLPKPITVAALTAGLTKVEWPARLQKITSGKLAEMLPEGWELWLDGGHNDSAGEVLAKQAERWDMRPLYVIAGMLKSKNAQEFLRPLAPHIQELQAIAIPEEELSFTAEEFSHEAINAGICHVATSPSLADALQSLMLSSAQPSRILICGSLYLAGEVLRQNGG